MRKVHRSERVPYTAEQMFDLVNDVESYPAFLHWCRGARVESESADRMVASIDVGVGGIHKSFKTRNTLDRPRSIRMELVAGPFRRFSGEWRFTPLPGGGTEVVLELEFEVSPSPFNIVFSLMFEELVRSQVSAFIARARVLHGAAEQS